MKSKIYFIKTAFVLTVFVALIAFPTISSAHHYWGNYHWARTSNPFTIKIGNNVTSKWKTEFNTAVADWDVSKVINLSPVKGTAGKRCSMVAGTVQVCNGAYGDNGWLGLASIYITDDDHITQGTAQVNDTYFNTAAYNNPNEKLHVMCQEIGHTFGLGHTSEDGSSQNTCMDYSNSNLSTRPNLHDYEFLESIYAHLDTINTTSTVFSSKPSASEEVTSEPNSWGRLMSQSAKGRSSTYERRHSNGSRTITHVYWTEEAAKVCDGCDHRFHDAH